MGNRTDPQGGSIFNICTVFYTHWNDIWITTPTPWEGRYSTSVLFLYTHWNDIWVTQLTPWGVRYWTFVLLLHALERHIGNKTDPMGGSIFNICIVFYVHLNDIRAPKLKPWGIDIQQLYWFLPTVERHMGNKTDPMGGFIFNMCIVCCTIFNICIVFYMHWNDI